MKRYLEVSRRKFMKTAALLSASAVAGLPAIEGSTHLLAQQPRQTKEIAMAPVFPYGAVYFRKSNPPAEDWARDHQTAARVGMNTFRHWFLWGAIEVAPGKFDWADYDRMMGSRRG